MIVILVSFLVALSICAFCSLCEACLLSLTPKQMDSLSKTKPGVASRWQRWRSDLGRPLTALLFLNTAACAVGPAIAAYAYRDVFREGTLGGWPVFCLTAVFCAALIFVFGQILPRNFGIARNREVAELVAWPLNVLVGLLGPVVRLTRLMGEAFRTETAPDKPLASFGEALKRRDVVLTRVQPEGTGEESPDLSETPVRDILVPLEEITFLSSTQTLMDAVIRAHMDPHTRFPVCAGEDRNDVLGYANFKEMIYHMRFNPQDPSLNGIIRPVHFVGPRDTLAGVLGFFADEHIHLAIVREGGKTLGLVTLEDIVEFLVAGSREEALEAVPKRCHELSAGTWMVGGGVPAAEFSKRLGIPLPEARGTMCEWLIQRMGDIPKTAELYRVGGLKFIVWRTRRGKVFEVAVRKTADTGPPVLFPEEFQR